jgi:hypothetical protein
MKYSKMTRTLFAAALVMGFSTAAFAQATRTWVSGTGSDANPCSRTAPCQTFSGAQSKTAANGEISALDPGGFGAITIIKGLTLNGTGTLASILAANTTGVVVNAPLATDIVILRDISINGAGTTTGAGIRYLSGGSLMVDHCWIHGMKGTTTSNGRGISVEKTSNGRLKLLDTVIENVGQDGIFMTTSAGEITATIDRSRIMNCAQDGIEASANSRAAIRDSVVSHITFVGVKTSGANSFMNIDDALVTYAGTGLQASAGSSHRVSDTIIAQNGTGLSLNAGTIDSFQGNSLIGNGIPGAFSTTTAKQ